MKGKIALETEFNDIVFVIFCVQNLILCLIRKQVCVQIVKGLLNVCLTSGENHKGVN